MKKLLLTTVLLSNYALATVDSYVTLKIPVASMNEPKVCLISTLAHDGISNMGTKEMLAMNALNSPFKIHGIQAGEDAEGLVDANMLSGKGVHVGFELDYDSYPSKGELTIDASAATAKATTLEERSEVINSVKVALVAGLENTLNARTLNKVKVTLKGLPLQTGIAKKIPAKFSSDFSLGSPYLKTLKSDLKVVTDISKCN